MNVFDVCNYVHANHRVHACVFSMLHLGFMYPAIKFTFVQRFGFQKSLGASLLLQPHHLPSSSETVENGEILQLRKRRKRHKIDLSSLNS